MSEQPETEPRAARPVEALQLGIVALRPLTLPDFVSGTAQALRRNAGALLGVGFAVAVAAELLTWLVVTLTVGEVPAQSTVAADAQDWATIRPYLIAMSIRVAVVALLGLLLVAVVNVVVPRAVFGHTTGARAAVGQAASALPRLLGVMLLMFAFFAAPILVGVLALLAGPLGVLVFLPVLVGVVYLAIAFGFGYSVAVVEGAGGAVALERSRKLVHAVGWWR
ncbi:MAG: hypothetical protein M3548_19355, partial [Actinomycetota bacterium]|nr:hypothetical protein [Actinomycetota bacterium]